MAECGGMMFLTRSLTVRQGGTAYAMTGILPLDCTMVGARLHLGYRRIEYKGMELRGHEFHYSNVVAPDAMPSVAKQFTARGMEVSTRFIDIKCDSRVYPFILGRNGYIKIMGSNEAHLYTYWG